MAELVGIYAASHTPVMLNFPQAVSENDRDEVFTAYRQMGEQIAAAAPDTLLVFSTDHLHNFFLDNFPAICVGLAESYDSPIEHWLNAKKRKLKGDAALGAHIVSSAFNSGFDPAFSCDLTLDHGALTPLELAGVAADMAIVPILFNCVQPPMPTMQRCFDFGCFIGQAIRGFPEDKRIAVLATGGISHDIATPRMGMVNEVFDKTFLELMLTGDSTATVRYATDHVHEAGNGAEEIRMWLAALGVAGGTRFEQDFYRAVHDWYTGIGLGHWKL
jgi:protocatechuate 4,5-dioxygenase beta chain